VRVTQEKLIQLAQEEAERRGQTENVLSGYLIGSVASGDAIIGESADIDLVLIHRFTPDRQREIVPLSNDIHLDICHHSSDLYAYPPDLRTDPWLGPSMCEPIFLYDPDHFFERAQAGVRGQFYRSDHTLARASEFLKRARKTKSDNFSNPMWVLNYIGSALDAANALATLGGFPIAGRRISILLQARFRELNLEGSWTKFSNLLGENTEQEEHITDWITAWEDAFDASSHHDPMFHPARKNYYMKSFLSFIDLDTVQEIVWVLIPTWCRAMQALPEEHHDDQTHIAWETALEEFRLSIDERASRNDQLEDFHDHVEEILENWD
jgi:hypothetical protein